MRLAEFIRTGTERILREWEELIRLQRPEAALPRWVLRAPAAAILRSIAEALDSSSTEEQASQGAERAAAVHVDLRIESGFDLAQIVAEYSALRACILRLWRASYPQAFREGAGEVSRLTEAIDEIVAQSVQVYEQREAKYRDRFLGMLGHDLRNPLNSISLGAASLAEASGLSSAHRVTVSRILNSVRRLDRMVSDILDFARGRLGSPMPLFVAPTDLEALLREIADEVQSTNPGYTIELKVEGDVAGEWDADRLKQATSNLLLNAIQHGGGQRIGLFARRDGDFVVVQVHNEGPPIPKDLLGAMFDPLVHGKSSDQNRPGLGLGLFIVNEIVSAHHGSIEVSSSAQEGTTFTVRLPACSEMTGPQRQT
jgi:signal transduction histidine kinase